MNFASLERRFIRFPFTFSLKENYLIHLIVFLNLAITVPLASILNIWTDEAYSLDTTGKSLQYAITQAINFELQPPLYFALLNIWRSINGSIFWARLFSIIAVAVTIYLVALLAKRLIKTINTVCIVAAFAFNPFTIKVALEIRVYAFIILLSALLLWFFFKGYFDSKPSGKAKLLYLSLAVISLYSHYYLACLLIANGIVLLVLRRWQSLKNYLWGMSLVALCFFPMLFFLLKQVSTHTSNLGGNFWQNFAAIQGSKIQGFMGNFTDLPQTILITCCLLFFVLLLGAIFTIDIRLIKHDHLAIWTINLTSIIFFIGVLVITNGMLLFRHTASIFIVSSLGLFLLLSLIKYPRIRNTITISLTVAILLFYAQNLSKNYSVLAKAGDWKRVSEYIMTHEQPQQEILVFTSISAEELSYYYNGINKIIPLPKADDFQNYDLQNYALNNEAEIKQVLLSDRHDLWLVERVNRNCKSFGTDLNCHILENFVSKYYNVENTQNFYKSQVRFLSAKIKP